MSMAELYDKIMHNVRISRDKAAEDLEDGTLSREEYNAYEFGLGVALQVIADVMAAEQEKEQQG